MNLDAALLNKAVHDTTVEQIAEQYRRQGYDVVKDETIDDGYVADLVARKANDTVVFEVINRKNRDADHRTETIANIVRNNGYRFHVVFAAPPRAKKIEIDNIDELLNDYFHQTPPDFDSLPGTVNLDEVVDTEIDDISIENDIFHVAGNAAFEVDIEIGDGNSKSDFRHPEYKYIPFHFKAVLKYDANHQLTVAGIEMELSSK